MSSCTRRLLSLVAFSLLCTQSFAAAEESAAERFVDEVGTMALDQELDAFGNLGGVTVDQLGFIYVANFRDAV